MVTVCGDTSSLRGPPTLHPAPGLCRLVVGKALSSSAGGQGRGWGELGLAGDPHPGSIWGSDRSLQAEPCASWSLASSSDKCPQQPQTCL